MQLKKSLLLFAVCSFLGCNGDGPKVPVCILDAENMQLECSNAEGDRDIIPIEFAHGFACFDPDDFKEILDYVKRKCK